MDIALQVFVIVAELRNFSRAAERLHMTQPAVSQHIRALEQQLGAKLLERSSKSVSLTRAGGIVLGHAREIGAQYGRMRERIDELSGSVRGPLAIGASYTFGEYALPQTMAELLRVYPEIAPSIAIGNTAGIADRLRGKELDIGIVEGEEIGQGLEAEAIAGDEMVVVAGGGHTLARAGEADVAELCEAAWLVRETGSGTRAAAEAVFAAWRMRPQRLMELGSTQLVKEMAMAGLGIALLSRWSLRRELADGSLTLVSAPALPFRRSYYLLRRRGDPGTRTLEAFVAQLKQTTARQMREAGISPPAEQADE